MKEIIRNINIVIIYLIITPSVFAFFNVDPNVLSDVSSNYVDGQTVAVNVKHVVECWNLCQNCSFFSWDTKSLTCHYGELVKQQLCKKAKEVY